MTALRSYVSGAWTDPADDGRPVLDAVTGEEVARVSSAGAPSTTGIRSWTGSGCTSENDSASLAATAAISTSAAPSSVGSRSTCDVGAGTIRGDVARSPTRAIANGTRVVPTGSLR